MARYIDADKAKKEFSENFGSVTHAVIANRIIDEVPTEDVEIVRHGRWEVYEYEAFPLVVFLYRCSLCKADAPAERGAVYAQVKTAYCPNCGAIMENKDKEQ